MINEMDGIDIVVPWVNPSDPVWQNENKKYSSNKGDNSRQRTRDIGIFKYFFRGIDKNCSWVRKVHLLLFGESQIPSWLNVNHPKLMIHYHKDYIPSELLPTFNTFVIEAFFHKIPGLAEKFITCNDDMIWCNKTESTDYFIGNKSIDNPRLTKWYTCNPVHDRLYRGAKFNMFQNVLKASGDIEEKITGKRNYYYNYHVPFGLNKSLIQFIWLKYENILMNALKDSRFRRDHNFVSWMYRYIKLDINNYIKSDIVNTDFAYFELNSVKDLNTLSKLINTKKNVCLNDMLTERSEKQVGQQVNKILEIKFPEKSTFER